MTTGTTVHLIHTIHVRNGMTRYQYIIVPPSHADEGRHLGCYPDVASAYRAVIAKGGVAYLHCPEDFPIKMRDANDTHGLAWRSA
jgi:hypothetical protein